MELDWFKFTKIADRFQYKAKFEDREDLRQDIILRLAEISSKNGHKPFSEASMVRIASYTVADYWRKRFERINGIDCRWCSKEQRAKCHQEWLWDKCPKAIQIESLFKPIVEADGSISELGELIADDKAIDLDLWLDNKTWLMGCPRRLLQIGVKIYSGKPLDKTEARYIQRQRQKELKKYQLALK